MFRTALALLLSLTLIAQPAAAFAHQAEYSSESKTIGVSTGVTGISPSFSPGFSAEDKASSQTLATISPGAIITGEPTDLSGLNREKTKAHQKLEKIFDLEALKEDAEFAEVASEVVSRATAPILKMIGEKYTDKEIDTVTHKLLHAVVGCGTGALTGGDCGSGAIGGAVGETVGLALLSDKRAEEVGAELGEALQSGELTPEQAEALAYKWEQQGVDLSKLAAGLSAALVGGNVDVAANTAETAVENNALCGGACIAGAIVAIGALWTAYDVATTYQEEGGEAALKQLALDGAITVVSAGAGKIAYKIGGKVFKSAPKAWEAVKKSGLLKKGGKGVPKPTVSDPKLSNLVKDLYKGANTNKPIGTGSTADAIRQEAITGQPVGGKFHAQKGQEYINALNKWIRKNPNAAASDRAAAQSMLDDLTNALGGSSR